jgi:hypothetical protein
MNLNKAGVLHCDHVWELLLLAVLLDVLGLCFAYLKQIPRGLKPARDDKNKELNGAPEGAPLQEIR